VGTARCLLKSKGLSGWLWGGGGDHGDGSIPPQAVANKKSGRKDTF
jgi:hypothetical protein